jgi:hypothetical protein
MDTKKQEYLTLNKKVFDVKVERNEEGSSVSWVEKYKKNSVSMSISFINESDFIDFLYVVSAAKDMYLSNGLLKEVSEP